MKLLIDTHVLIWWTRDQDRLPKRVQSKLLTRHNEIFVSTVTAWEIAIKFRSGKLDFDPGFLADFDKSLAGLAFLPLAMTSLHAVTAAALPGTHRDPFDRMLAGQAAIEQMSLVRSDRKFASFGVPIIW